MARTSKKIRIAHEYNLGLCFLHFWWKIASKCCNKNAKRTKVAGKIRWSGSFLEYPHTTRTIQKKDMVPTPSTFLGRGSALFVTGISGENPSATNCVEGQKKQQGYLFETTTLKISGCSPTISGSIQVRGGGLSRARSRVGKWVRQKWEMG